MKAVIDSNVILHGREALDFEEVLTVEEVMDEMKSHEGSRRFDNIDVSVFQAPEKELEKVRDKSEEINSPTSETDEKLVALADKKDGTVISDDKAVQNLALHLDIDFQGYMERAIEEKRKWKILCPECSNEGISSQCPRCGCQDPVRKPC
ncbi:MAG: hypothetical protein ABEK10_03730 [Candidatus Nanosalina sp.]